MIARYASPAGRMLPIVSSEWGYSTAEGAVSEAVQANYLSRQWLANLAAGVNVSIFYDWRDDGDDPKDRECRFGTVRRNLDPKPSYVAAQSLIRSLTGYAFRHRIAGSSDTDWKLLFQKGDDPAALILVEWSADPRSDPSRQTPRFRTVGVNDADAAGFRRLAGIRIKPGPLAEDHESPPVLELNLLNSEHLPARIRVIAQVPHSPVQEPLHVDLQHACASN